MRSELSVGVEFDGKETLIPTMVPGLTDKELDSLLNLKPGDAKSIPESVMKKAVAHARKRIAQGKSPFIEEGEAVTPTKTTPVGAKKVEPRLPPKIEKQIARKDKFSDVKEILALDNETFERFISVTPASRRTADVNTAISQRLKLNRATRKLSFDTPEKARASVQSVVKTLIPTIKNAPKNAGKIFDALVFQESKFESGAKSRVGARGLAQIMPGTAKLIADKSDLGFTAKQILNDPLANVQAGVWLLFSNTWPRFKNTDDQLAFSLADYNANPALIRAREKVGKKDRNTFSKVFSHLPKETQDYVNIIKKALK